MAQENRSRLRRRLGLIAAAAVLVGILAFGIANLGVPKVLKSLASANLAWVAAALALMMLSLFMRAVSWHEVLRAALPNMRIRWAPVVRATMIGVMGSAVFPGRVGEAARVLILTRHLDGSARRNIPVVAGTVFSQTLINILALAILGIATFSSVSVFRGHETGLVLGSVFALGVVAIVLVGPRLLSFGQRSRRARVARASAVLARLLALARQGLVVFLRPRHGIAAVAAQFGAWGLQWLSCYAVLLALSLESKAGPIAAAAVLLAVNVAAVLPPTPSNVGVFQAACIVVLAAFGVSAGEGLAYGILLQAVEVVTALALGTPALLGEGMTWREVRLAVSESRSEEQRALEDVEGDAEQDRPASEGADGEDEDRAEGARGAPERPRGSARVDSATP
jgi:phosphatidyl-myo-inositol alpha-mannosyltransferase